MSVLAYIASLAVGIAVMVVYGIDLGETQAIPPEMWYAGAITAIIFAALFAAWYFRSPKVDASAQEGLKFGLVMIVTGFVLDLVSFLPLLTHEDPYDPILEYYSSPFFWVTLVLVVVAAALTGNFLGAKKSTN